MTSIANTIAKHTGLSRQKVQGVIRSLQRTGVIGDSEARTTTDISALLIGCMAVDKPADAPAAVKAFMGARIVDFQQRHVSPLSDSITSLGDNPVFRALADGQERCYFLHLRDMLEVALNGFAGDGFKSEEKALQPVRLDIRRNEGAAIVEIVLHSSIGGGVLFGQFVYVVEDWPDERLGACGIESRATGRSVSFAVAGDLLRDLSEFVIAPSQVTEATTNIAAKPQRTSSNG